MLLPDMFRAQVNHGYFAPRSIFILHKVTCDIPPNEHSKMECLLNLLEAQMLWILLRIILDITSVLPVKALKHANLP